MPQSSTSHTKYTHTQTHTFFMHRAYPNSVACEFGQNENAPHDEEAARTNEMTRPAMNKTKTLKTKTQKTRTTIVGKGGFWDARE